MRGTGLALALLLTMACRSGAPTKPGPNKGAAAPVALVPPLAQSIDGIPVVDEDGKALAFPFLGGLDHPRPQLADIDGDGDADLFLQEYPDQLRFFERVDGSAANAANGGAGGAAARFVWRTDRFAGLDVGEWSRFVDIDGDGDLDLLAEEPFSLIRLYRNTGDRRQAAFTAIVDSIEDVSGTAIFADRQNIPEIADIDCNGKLDLLIGRIDGTVTRYEMQSLDERGAPRFALLSGRFQNIQIVGQLQPSRHGANTMIAADFDRDGDLDILWGDFFEPGLLLIENRGTCQAPTMQDAPVPFPRNRPLRTSGYNAPALGDLDGDGDADLVVGVLGGAFEPTRTTRDNLYWLEQTDPAIYEVRSRRLLDGIDVGSESSPALADIDGDGDLDLVIGNKIEWDDSKTAALRVYRNEGTTTAPRFKFAERLPAARGYQYAPAFGDLDGDGDADMVLGSWRDEVFYYRNDGTGHFARADTALVRITRGSHTTPTLGDLDGDGDLDLLVGEASGTLNYYENTGTKEVPAFTLVSDEYTDISGVRRSVPRLVDLDGDGDLDLVVGTERGPAYVFRNEGKSHALFERDTTVDWRWPPFSSPAFGDLDGDGDPDVLVGSSGGGVLYFRNERPPKP